MKINIAITGAPCTLKTTVARLLAGTLGTYGLHYDLVDEEARNLKKEFGHCESTFDRFYLWRQQEREELRSTAKDGFITDTPLLNLYGQAVYHSTTSRDKLAERELLRMCLDLEDRYQIIAIAADPEEIHYHKDNWRKGSNKARMEKHHIMTSFCSHYFKDRVLLVRGSAMQRVRQIIKKLEELRGPIPGKKKC